MDDVCEAIGIIPRPVSEALGKGDFDCASVYGQYETSRSDADQETQKAAHKYTRYVSHAPLRLWGDSAGSLGVVIRMELWSNVVCI